MKMMKDHTTHVLESDFIDFDLTPLLRKSTCAAPASSSTGDGAICLRNSVRFSQRE